MFRPFRPAFENLEKREVFSVTAIDAWVDAGCPNDVIARRDDATIAGEYAKASQSTAISGNTAADGNASRRGVQSNTGGTNSFNVGPNITDYTSNFGSTALTAGTFGRGVVVPTPIYNPYITVDYMPNAARESQPPAITGSYYPSTGVLTLKAAPGSQSSAVWLPGNYLLDQQNAAPHFGQAATPLVVWIHGGGLKAELQSASSAFSGAPTQSGTLNFLTTKSAVAELQSPANQNSIATSAGYAAAADAIFEQLGTQSSSVNENLPAGADPLLETASADPTSATQELHILWRHDNGSSYLNRGGFRDAPKPNGFGGPWILAGKKVDADDIEFATPNVVSTTRDENGNVTSIVFGFVTTNPPADPPPDDGGKKKDKKDK